LEVLEVAARRRQLVGGILVFDIAGLLFSDGTAARKRLKSKMPVPKRVSLERSATVSLR
jgi:hypothetical protein